MPSSIEKENWEANMGYIRAEEILPEEIVALLQEYAEGQMLYIPKKKENKAGWGALSGAKDQLGQRNIAIYREYLAGVKMPQLAEKYFLTEKSIQRIVREMKREP